MYTVTVTGTDTCQLAASEARVTQRTRPADSSQALTGPVRVTEPRQLANNAGRQPAGSASSRPVADAEWRLNHRPDAVGRARQLARAVLVGWNTPEDETEAAVLVVSELVTNAVEHAEPPLVLHLHRQQADHRVWIGVSDGGAAAQDGAWTSSCAPDEHGRGLHLVEALAQAHGMCRRTRGTTHWARMAA